MSEKKIECFFDIVSPYSYFAYVYLLKNRAALDSHGVILDFIPVFLGGINHATGNKPPFTLPAKAAYGKHDSRRAKDYFDMHFETPSFFPILSLLPQRSLVHIKDQYDSKKFEDTIAALFAANWDNAIDTSKPEGLKRALTDVFTAAEIDDIVTAATSSEAKGRLSANTERAVKDCGAFGAPWFWITNGEEQSPIFGSDRWHYMWRALDLPFQDVQLKAKL